MSILPIIVKAVIETGKPACWVIGIGFLAAFENEALVIKSMSFRDPSNPTDEEIAPGKKITRNTICGIPFVCSANIPSDSAFLLDGECKVLKQISVPSKEDVHA